MPFEQTINGKKYKVNVSPEQWTALQERLEPKVPTPEEIVPEEKENGWRTSPISPKLSGWIQEKTEPEEDDWYATRVGKRIGRVLGEDINSPLGAGITAAATIAGPVGWAAKAGKLGAGALKAASSAKAVKAGKAAQVGFGGLGVAQTPELVKSGADFLKTKTPESLADAIISGTEVAGGGYLLGSAAKARRAKKPAEDIVDKVFGEEKPSSELWPSLTEEHKLKNKQEQLAKKRIYSESEIRKLAKKARQGNTTAKESLLHAQDSLRNIIAKEKELSLSKPKKDSFAELDKGIDAALSKLDLPERPLNFDLDKPTKAGTVKTKPDIPEPDAILNTEPSSKPFQARTVAESEAGGGKTRPVERARDWISEGSSTLVDKVQPLKPSSKADEKLLRQTLEVMVERQVQNTGKTPTENAVKRLRSQIVTKIGDDSNKKFAELGKIFSAQKKQLAAVREAGDTSLRLPDIEFDMDSVDFKAIPSKIRPQAKEFVRSAVTLAD